MLFAPSSNFDTRRAKIDTLVLHYTGMESGNAALSRMRDPQAKVSAHYMVEENGEIIRLIEEQHRAWHCGVASWMGEQNLNCRSIGIEIVNGGHDFGLPDFPEPQIVSVIALAREILSRHSIPPPRIVAHSDIAPDRKRDPGEKFPWSRLAAAGIGLWPREAAPNGPPRGDLGKALSRIGYAIGSSADHPVTGHAITAFQRRFLPHLTGNGLDDETRNMIWHIADMVEQQA